MNQPAQEYEPRYTMTVDLSVLEALGINLYSNAAAVLSELVANAYDADANVAQIQWKQDGAQVVARDDGLGMTVPELNERFLTVGYKKRDNEGLRSPKFDRPFMGRKGIGKLSVFSIARTISVYSTKDDENNGLRIVVEDLERSIKEGVDYHPQPVDVPEEYRSTGTALVLERLKTKRADLTANALRKRLARRFDVLDETPPEEGGFRIDVNSKPITYEDRQDLKTLQFIWEFGAQTLPASALPKNIRRFVLPDDAAGGNPSWKVRGWIGTAKKPADLTSDEEMGSLKNVIVLARKRPIQEGIIEKLDFSQIFGNYVTGQIEADFLDLDGDYEDIATSDRQRLMEDDERVLALQAFLRRAFVKAADTWSEERPKREARDALEKFPELKRWVEERPEWQQQAARKMIGTIASLTLENEKETDRAALLRAGVLAFERVGLRAIADDLDQLSTVTAAELLPLLGQQDVYEEALWGDILRSRVEAISKFRDLTDANEKERVLQEHLFKNLWLLDPSWERATGSERMEENLRTIEPGMFPLASDGTELKGRLDIRYATQSGRHVIVELKRYDVRLDATELAAQGLKYFDALNSILEQQGKNRFDGDIEVIFVLGAPPGSAGKGRLAEAAYFETQFLPFNGRYSLYDELIENANNQYEEYLEASSKVQSLNDLLAALGPEDSSASS